jgi:hypothetical protein
MAPINQAMHRTQAASSVLMIRPAAFGFNADAAVSNALQQPSSDAAADISERARREFDGLAAALVAVGVRVCILEDTLLPPKPDAVFPNNWLSFHEDGTAVLYPLQPASRRPERRREVIERVSAELGFRVRRLLDLSEHEARGEFLEGTGSLVLDHVRRIAYACRSPRTSETLVERWCSLMGYEPVIFDASDTQGRPYYHTNVMLSVGTSHAIVATESIAPHDREAVLRSLQLSGCELVQVSRAAVTGFAGNVLELTGHSATAGSVSVLVMSEAARAAIGDALPARLKAKFVAVVAVPVPTIEQVGGGSVRCMLAEVFAAS